MYLDEYKRWLAADLEDADLKPELAKVEGNDDEIKDRFAVALKFGTAGLRGVLGAGTNRMNIYVVRQATQGLANWVLTQGGTQTVAISYDSRLKSDVFAKTAAGVLAANGIKVRIYDALMPVPALSFATRYYNCNAGIMVTASHNPAKYNGYKAYGPDGCQMTDDAAAIVYDEIQKTDVLTGAKYISFAEGVENGMIRFVGDDCKKALYDAIEARQVRPGLCKTAGLKLVYSPLNGSGLVPVLIILVTGEFLPKTIFKINPNLVLNVFAIPLIICYFILYPISKLASGLSCLFLRVFGMKINKDASDRAFGKVDLDYFVQSSIDNAENEEELDTEVKIFQNALDFSNIKIRDCIVPRTEVVAVDLTTSLDELKSRFIESGISKIIVYDGNIDNVVGYIHSSEMFRAPKNWHENVKQVPIVPETMSANKLMKLFMQQKKTIAVVVDEFGGTSGIVSLEDLVEEIFGDIEDEHDNTSYISKQIDEREYVLSARLEIEKVNETFGLDLPESDDYLTVGGLILNQYQSFPKLHEVVRVGRYQFKIIKVTATKIELVRLKVLE